jgi:uncharacterized protein YacL
LIRYIRLLGGALGGLVGLAIASANDGIFVGSDYAGALLAVWVVAWIVVGFAVLPYLTVVPATWLIARVEELSTAEFVTAVIGFLLGLLMGLLLGFPLSNFPEPWGQILPLAVSLSLGLGMVGLTVAKRKDLVVAAEALGIFRRTDPDKDAPARAGEPHIVVDTSAIIDGRIGDIVRTGFLGGELVVPEFVLKELQQVADSADPLKRARGRRGLEVVQDLRSDIDVATPDVDFPQVPDVDAKLLKLAKERGVPILTTDFNLNRLAQIQDVKVLNVNELANALKPAVLPGERLDITLIREGKEPGQGVGYLDDGTMVVVEGAGQRVGQTLPVQVTSVLQQPSGKIIFTRLGDRVAGEG